ncbi:hypothetical protein IK146_01725 [Candidatus Saccharibacteria bacterium]|nr:hypothetical protein [Candidatus Saccharibacteria bacterium]
MKKLIIKASQALSGAAALATLSAGKVMALSVRDGINAAKTDDMPSDLINNSGTGVISNITNTILYVLGFISVVMLIIGGVKYALSAGDAKAVTDAKNTILYALIGLVIAILSYAIVNFIVGLF